MALLWNCCHGCSCSGARGRAGHAQAGDSCAHVRAQQPPGFLASRRVQQLTPSPSRERHLARQRAAQTWAATVTLPPPPPPRLCAQAGMDVGGVLLFKGPKGRFRYERGDKKAIGGLRGGGGGGGSVGRMLVQVLLADVLRACSVLAPARLLRSWSGAVQLPRNVRPGSAGCWMAPSAPPRPLCRAPTWHHPARRCCRHDCGRQRHHPHVPGGAGDSAGPERPHSPLPHIRQRCGWAWRAARFPLFPFFYVCSLLRDNMPASWLDAASCTCPHSSSLALSDLLFSLARCPLPSRKYRLRSLPRRIALVLLPCLASAHSPLCNSPFTLLQRRTSCCGRS